MVKQYKIFLWCLLWCCAGCQTATSIAVEDRYATTWRATQLALQEEGQPHFETTKGEFSTENYESTWWNNLLMIASLGAFHHHSDYNKVQLTRTDKLKVQIEAISGSKWTLLYFPVPFNSQNNSQNLIQKIQQKLRTLEDPVENKFQSVTKEQISKKIAEINSFFGKMVYIPGGEFFMGNNEGDEDEKPRFKVAQKGFLLDTHEVSVQEYKEFLAANPENRHKEEPSSHSRIPLDWEKQLKNLQHPVVGISWFNAFDYAHWKGKRLPTESEFERALRGFNGRIYSYGNTFDATKCSASSLHGLQRIGSFANGANPEGCYDLTGNAWEWCQDWYQPNYYGAFRENPEGPENGTQRILRGGSFLSTSHELRASFRNRGNPTFRNIDVGFRCAKDGTASQNK